MPRVNGPGNESGIRWTEYVALQIRKNGLLGGNSQICKGIGFVILILEVLSTVY